jgi:hypothetical protein
MILKRRKTPKNTISALLGDFIRRGDTRIDRVLQNNGVYLYYLTENEHAIDFEDVVTPNNSSVLHNKKNQIKTFHERDLHILFNTYLNSVKIRAKTIYHGQG